MSKCDEIALKIYEEKIMKESKQEEFLNQLIYFLDLNVILYDSALENNSSHSTLIERLFLLVIVPLDIRCKIATNIAGDRNTHIWFI